MRGLFKFLFCPVVFLVPALSFSWNSTGHMVVAEIAYDNLSPADKIKVNNIAKALSVENFNSNYRDEGLISYASFISIAHWPDDIKGQDWLLNNPWHYQDNGWVAALDAGNVSIPSEFIIKTPNNDVVWAIGNMAGILSQDSKYQSAITRARALSYLVHFTGDIHQPLHCSVRVSPDFREGDEGGNDYKIKFDSPITELHGLWDDAVVLYPEMGYDPEDINPEDIKKIAKNIELQYPEKKLIKETTPPVRDSNQTITYWAMDWSNQWCQESFKLAESVVYPDLSPGAGLAKNPVKLEKNYLINSSKIAEQRLALAGYRLANLLHVVLNSDFDK